MELTPEQIEFDRLAREYIAEVSAEPEPSKKRWAELVDKYRGKANIESLLVYGASKGWVK